MALVLPTVGPSYCLGVGYNAILNTDGCMDLYLGPKAPVGREYNWLTLVSGEECFAVLGLYGPT